MADRSELDDILNRGVDVKNRRIYFGLLDSDDGAEITWHSVEQTIRAIQKLATDFPKKPIELYMSSPGGDLLEAFRLYDAIQSCTCQIKFYGSGSIMSAATLIMAGCDERYLDPNTSIMFHGIQLSYGDATSPLVDLDIAHDESKRANQKWLALLTENTRMPFDFWKEIAQRDTYLSSEEALMLGLADHIVEKKKRGSLRKSRTYALNQVPNQKDLTKLVKSIYDRIHQGKRVSKIEIHIPKDEFDNSLTIDTSPVLEEAQEEINPKI